jgi:hypothetical protein
MLSTLFLIGNAQPPMNPMRDPSLSVFSSLFGGGGFGRRGQPYPGPMPSESL